MTLHSDHNRSGGGSDTWPWAVSLSLHREVPLETQISTVTTLLLALWNKCTKQKLDLMKVFGKCPFFFSKSFQAVPKNSRGYENIQLSFGDESRLSCGGPLKNYIHFTGLRSHHSMVQTDPWVGALSVGFLCYMLQRKIKKTIGLVLHWCLEKIQERQSKRGLKDITYK